jgi:CspA family cold shock protein
MATDTQVDSNSSERSLGRVKWFNTKAGYGFITASEGERKDNDVFVHHSGISVDSEQYRYLVEGEYVEFAIKHTPGATHEIQADSVSGIRGGKLMCETRRDYRETRRTFQEANGVEPRGRPAPRQQEDEGWTLNETTRPTRPTPRPQGSGRGQSRPQTQGRGQGQGQKRTQKRPTIEMA